MSQYNIALLPENQTQKNNLQEIIEILDTIKLSATYQYPIWERLQTEHTSPNFYQQQELTLAKNTTCTLISPETEDPSGKGKYFIANQDQANIQLFCETFQLHTQMYSCRIFTEEHQTTPQDSHIRILSPLGSIKYRTLQIQDISPELRQILEKEHPDMAKFADQEIEDLIINIHIYNRKNSLKILEFAKNLQNPKFKRIILHESQQDNPYFLI